MRPCSKASSRLDWCCTICLRFSISETGLNFRVSVERTKRRHRLINWTRVERASITVQKVEGISRIDSDELSLRIVS